MSSAALREPVPGHHCASLATGPMMLAYLIVAVFTNLLVLGPEG